MQQLESMEQRFKEILRQNKLFRNEIILFLFSDSFLIIIIYKRIISRDKRTLVKIKVI